MHNKKNPQKFREKDAIQMQARNQNLKKGRGAILKEWDYCKRPWPEFLLFRPMNFGQNRKFKRFFGPNTGDLQKKRSSPNLKRIFGHNRIFRRFFRLNHGIYFAFSAPKFLWGAVFNFSAKIGLKSTKNVQFWILYRQMGGSSPPAPLLATLLFRSNNKLTWCNS